MKRKPPTPSPANQIRTAREAKGLTQAQLAELAGFSMSAISKFERKVTTPPVRSLKLILATIDAQP